MLKNVVKHTLVTIEPDAKVTKASQLMVEKNVGCLLVLENGKPRGLLTDRDIVVRCIAKNIDVDDCTVENILSESPKFVKETDGFFDVIRTMKEAGVRRIPVVDGNGKAVGIVSFGDILSVLGEELYTVTRGTTPSKEEREAA